jgi:rhomboid protease GluP
MKPSSQNNDDQPIAYDSHSVLNPISPFLLLIAGAAALIEIVLMLAENDMIGGPNAHNWRTLLIQNYGFYDPIFEQFRETGFSLFFTNPQFALTFIAYPFVSYNLPGTLVGVVIFLAVGRAVSIRFSIWAALVIFAVGIISGALAYGFVSSSGLRLLGMFQPCCALIGAYSWTEYRYRQISGAPIWPAFRILFFLAILNMVQYLFFQPTDFWVAELAAFLAGFGLSYLLAPGAARRIVARLRGN